MNNFDYCPDCGITEFKNDNGKPTCTNCGRVVTEEEIAADIKARFQELGEESKTLEKYEALLNYIEAYDFKNLPTLMFPKDDAEYLRIACEKQIPKEVNTEYDDEFTCPTCGETTEDYDVTTFKVCPHCGQRLKWD